MLNLSPTTARYLFFAALAITSIIWLYPSNNDAPVLNTVEVTSDMNTISYEHKTDTVFVQSARPVENKRIAEPIAQKPEIDYFAISIWHIKAFEACIPYPYKCSGGEWTLGFGHLIADDEFGTALTGWKSKSELNSLWASTSGRNHLSRVKSFGKHFSGRKTVDTEWCHAQFASDISAVHDRAKQYSEEPHVQWALTMFAYNVGWGNVMKGHRTGTALARHDWLAFADAMELYVNANGKPQRGLIARRKFEADLMRGKIPDPGEIEKIRELNSQWW